MRFLILSLLVIGASGAFAAGATEGQITMSSPTATTTSTATNLGEVTMQYSSINNGSLFATVGVMRELDNGFAFGARGYVPMQYTNQGETYMAQAVGRFILLNDVNQMFIEGTLTQGFFNTTSSTSSFQMVGADFGFTHKINNQISVGGVLGVDYSPYRISQNTISNSSGSTFYNRIAVVGSYYF